MNDLRPAPLSPVEAERFFAEGEDALTAESGSHSDATGYSHAGDAPPESSPDLRSGRGTAGAGAVPIGFPGGVSPAHFRKPYEGDCCVGVDLPGYGRVHAPDCPAMARRGGLPEPLPEPLRTLVADPQRVALAGIVGAEARKLTWEIDAAVARSNERRARTEMLLRLLLVGAWDLAQSRVADLGAAAGYVLRRQCLDCARLLDVEGHARDCKTGAVLSLLRAAAGVLEGTEDVAAGETGQPGEGIFRAAPKLTPCLECGSEAGAWDAITVPGTMECVGALELNQVLKKGAGGNWTIYTHRCAEGGAR